MSTSYIRTGQVQAVTDPNGNQTRSTYDLNDRLASVTQPVAPSITRVTRFSYDALVVLGRSIHADSGMGS